MFTHPMRFAAAALLAAGLVGVPARASREPMMPGSLGVNDGAKLFTPAGVEQAKAVLKGTDFDHGLIVRIDTVEAPPAEKKAAAEAASHDKKQWGAYMADWAKERAAADKSEGIYVLVCRHPGGVAVIADHQTAARGFTDADEAKLREIITKGLSDSFEKGKDKADGPQTRDAALKAGAEFVVSRLKDTTVPEHARTSAGKHDAPRNTGGGSNLMGWVCLGLLVLGGAWLVVALVRAFRGGSGGAGGGGGGFFPSLLGGLFGAAAGMWLYSHFFGGGGGMFGGGGDAYAGDAGGGDAGGGDTGAGDYGGETGSGGGFDDGGGGGDWGGGGGDFGGGDF